MLENCLCSLQCSASGHLEVMSFEVISHKNCPLLSVYCSSGHPNLAKKCFSRAQVVSLVMLISYFQIVRKIVNGNQVVPLCILTDVCSDLLPGPQW